MSVVQGRAGFQGLSWVLPPVNPEALPHSLGPPPSLQMARFCSFSG